MLSRSLTFLVWALVAASAVAWGVKLMARPLAVPPGTTIATPTVATAGDLTPLFGAKAAAPDATAEAAPPPPPESSRFQLIGVVAARHAARAQGVALIAVDGKTARAYRVGAVVDGDLVLQAVHARAATIGPRGGVALVSLELPPLPPPATGVPGAVPGVMPGAMPGVVPGVVPGAAPGSLPVAPGLPSMPAPGQSRPGLPVTPVIQPGQAFPPSAAPNLQAQPRMRTQRFGSLPTGITLPGGSPPAAQEDAPPPEAPAPPDGRNVQR